MIIGVLGGFGTCATLHFFKQYISVFPAEKEWERPRIIIDNNCTIPSRVRGILYGENIDVIVESMINSIKYLISAGATKIIIACNTAHFYLDKIYNILPESRNYVVNIIDNLVAHLSLTKVNRVYLMATEGTILSNIYQTKLNDRNIECLSPSIEEFPIIRNFIEAVKKNNCYRETISKFIDFVYNKSLIGGGGN